MRRPKHTKPKPRDGGDAGLIFDGVCGLVLKMCGFVVVFFLIWTFHTMVQGVGWILYLDHSFSLNTKIRSSPVCSRIRRPKHNSTWPYQNIDEEWPMQSYKVSSSVVRKRKRKRKRRAFSLLLISLIKQKEWCQKSFF